MTIFTGISSIYESEIGLNGFYPVVVAAAAAADDDDDKHGGT
jgi:uncharacterized protein YceK